MSLLDIPAINNMLDEQVRDVPYTSFGLRVCYWAKIHNKTADFEKFKEVMTCGETFAILEAGFELNPRLTWRTLLEAIKLQAEQ